MTADLQDLFDQAGRNPPARAWDADTVLRRARRAHQHRVTVAVAAAVVVALALVAGLGSQRLLSADPAPAAPRPTTSPQPVVQVPGTLGQLAYELDGDIYVADPDGSNPVRIADGTPGIDGDCPSYWTEGPLWSPDGRYLAYRGDTGGDEVSCSRTVNISDPDGHRLASFPAEGWAIAWSPDSTRVAVWLDFYQDPKIGIFGLDGVRQALLTVPPGLMAGGDSDPVWSPDGTSLLVPLGVVIPVDGSTPRKLPEDDPRSQWRAKYSPDGGDVAYISRDGHFSLGVADADGSEADVLIPAGVEDHVWAPTRDRIAFVAQPDGVSREMVPATELGVVYVTGGEVQKLAVTGGDEVRVIEFSPQGDQILFSRTNAKDQTSLWSVRADGSDPHRLVAGTPSGDWQKVVPAR